MNDPPALVFVNRYYRPDESATSQMLTGVAERLAAQGISVSIICSRQLYENPAATLPHSEVIDGVHIRRVWTSRFGRRSLIGRACDYASFYISAGMAMCRLLRPGDILIAKTDPPMISVVAAWAARLRGAVLVNWLQDVFPEVAAKLSATTIPLWLYRPLVAARNDSLRYAHVNVVLGERMAQCVATFVNGERIKVIENWADGTLITPRPPGSSRLRGELGLDRSFVVGYSGNLGRAHEYATVLEAATHLAGVPRIVFLFIGGGAKLEELRRAVAQRKLNHFRFLPYQPRTGLADSLAAADVHLACLLPELEGLIVPSKAYGVLAAARPLISIGDPEGELARLVRANRCGAAVRCGDGAALAGEILRLEADPKGCAAMGQRARAAFERQYSLQSAVGRWSDLLGTLHGSLAQALPGAGSKLTEAQEVSGA
jgi:glycosyltransferase involved in cell wall biosynthesis